MYGGIAVGVLKYNSVRYAAGGVDIENTLGIRRAEENSENNVPAQEPENVEAAEEKAPEPTERELLEAAAAKLAEREAQIVSRERENERLKAELVALKEQYIEQGKEVILEARRRADELVKNAESHADEIVRDAEKTRGDVFIKARAEGFEQGRKDGIEACLAEGQGVLDEARNYAEQINIHKVELFKRYEKEIYETVMAIANKVTLDSMSVKDGTAAKKLIKKAAKDFRNSQMIRITLDENGASTELAGDYEYLKELCGGAARVEVELLADAEAGTVIVDNGEEITDAGIQTQLKMIRELGNGMFTDEAPKKRKKKASMPAEESEDPDERDDSADYIEE